MQRLRRVAKSLDFLELEITSQLAISSILKKLWKKGRVAGKAIVGLIVVDRNTLVRYFAHRTLRWWWWWWWWYCVGLKTQDGICICIALDPARRCNIFTCTRADFYDIGFAIAIVLRGGFDRKLAGGVLVVRVLLHHLRTVCEGVGRLVEEGGEIGVGEESII